jgi:hypothetical protein
MLYLVPNCGSKIAADDSDWTFDPDYRPGMGITPLEFAMRKLEATRTTPREKWIPPHTVPEAQYQNVKIRHSHGNPGCYGSPLGSDVAELVTGFCPDCGQPVIDGQAVYSCSYIESIDCFTCGFRQCYEHC